MPISMPLIIPEKSSTAKYDISLMLDIIRHAVISCPEIVSHTAGHAYSHDAEKLCLVQGIHYQYAKYAASKGVYHAEEACEKEACSQYAYAVYYKSVFEAQSVYGDYYNQVGEAKFDSGNRYGHRYQSFDIG